MARKTILQLEAVFCKKKSLSTNSDTGIVLQKSGLAFSRQQALKIFLKQLFQATSTLYIHTYIHIYMVYYARRQQNTTKQTKTHKKVESCKNF